MTNKISSKQKQEALIFILKNFGKISQREIARRLKIGKTTVNKWAKQIGLKYRKYTVNENFFDNLNEITAYVLGFVYADGNVCYSIERGDYAFTITSAAKDKDHLELIRQLMQITKPLLYSKKTNSYRLIIHNKKLVENLIFIGVIPRKSLIVEFPGIPDEVLSHFLRGVIDGDGSIYYNNRKRSPYFEVRIFSGSFKFCKELVRRVENAFNISASIRNIHGNTYQVTYSCARGKKLAKIIYSNSFIHLERKYETFRKNVLEVKNG